MKFVIAEIKAERKFENKDAEKLRGFIGNRFKEEVLFHNHLDDLTFNYHSSKIQYKVIRGELCIVGIDTGADIILNHLYDLEKINIGGEEIDVKVEITLKNFDLKVSDKKYKYRFETLWLALNSENYEKYKNGEFDLSAQIRNNIIEIFKMCSVWAEGKIEAEGIFSENIIQKKDTKMLGFSGEFQTNVELPDYIGLGKRKSIGFGTIRKIS